MHQLLCTKALVSRLKDALELESRRLLLNILNEPSEIV